MTRSTMLVLAFALGACDKGATNETLKNRPDLPATVTLTAVRFADDCGGTAPTQAPAAPPASRSAVASPARPAAEAPADMAAGSSAAIEIERRCEQTSMQLSITAHKQTQVQIKAVEVFDEKGTSLGVLASRAPTRWSDGQSAYVPWDGTIAAGETASVSYVLVQPSFVSPYEERDRTYTVKVIASVGGVDQPLQTSVMIVGRPAAVPT